MLKKNCRRDAEIVSYIILMLELLVLIRVPMSNYSYEQIHVGLMVHMFTNGTELKLKEIHLTLFLSIAWRTISDWQAGS